MYWQSNGHHLGIEVGDITAAEVDAVVNAANSRLAPGGGVAGAIHRAAGEELWAACRKLGGCATGEAVTTDGFALPARWIIHTVGPVHGVDEPSDRLLADCYRRCLDEAERVGAGSIAFPALSTGAFGYPMEAAAEVALATLLRHLPACRTLGEARMVLFDEASARLHQDTAARLAERHDWTRAD